MGAMLQTRALPQATAVIAVRIAMNHPFPDGTKDVGVAAADRVLCLNGSTLEVPPTRLLTSCSVPSPAVSLTGSFDLCGTAVRASEAVFGVTPGAAHLSSLTARVGASFRAGPVRSW